MGQGRLPGPVDDGGDQLPMGHIRPLSIADPPTRPDLINGRNAWLSVNAASGPAQLVLRDDGTYCTFSLFFFWNSGSYPFNCGPGDRTPFSGALPPPRTRGRGSRLSRKEGKPRREKKKKRNALLPFPPGGEVRRRTNERHAGKSGRSFCVRARGEATPGRHPRWMHASPHG
jgi:hypothetical protein